MAAPKTTLEDAERETTEICRTLIRMDTSNYGNNQGPGERQAAEYVAGLMSEVGLEPIVFESEPTRASVVTRLEGTSREPALVVHGHLDVVPAQKEDWSVDPFSAELKDGLIWGRGAVDMKDMDAMILASMRHMVTNGIRPKRDLIFAFFADEEAGGIYGSHYAVKNKPELFEGADSAISEVGGFSATIGGKRAYLIQTAEKGISWLRMQAHGIAGHGSQINTDNAVTHLAQAVANVGNYQWPIELTETTRALLDGVTELTGVRFDPDNPETILRELGTVARFVGATLQNTANPTALTAGYKHNVIPGSAEALIDSRTLPGQRDAVYATIKELVGPKVDLDYLHSDIDLEVPAQGPLWDAMVSSLHRADPEAAILPYTLSGGTDNKALSTLGIKGYGFAPLQLPDSLDFTGMFHGVDERVPEKSLHFGTRVLTDLLTNY